MRFSGLLILEVADMFDRWISRWVRADAAALLVLTLWAVIATHGSWMWFFVLFLLPDLSMMGYVFGPRVGAASYNLGHLYAWPVGLLAAGLTWQCASARAGGINFQTCSRSNGRSLRVGC